MKRGRPLERRTELGRGPAPRRKQPVSSGGRRKGFTPASPEQREKCANTVCLACGRDREFAVIDPAHITPRAWGGCDHRDCTIPLCRSCHRRFDGHGEPLSILEHLVANRMHVELAHALEHYNCDLVALLQRVTGERYVPSGGDYPLERAA